MLPRQILALARVFPVLSRVEAIATFPRRAFEIPDPKELRRSAFTAFRELVQRLAARATVVLLLDDLQWGDRDSAALLAELVRAPGAPPALLVLSCRTEDAEQSPLLTALQGGLGDVKQPRVEVGPLGPVDAERLAEILPGETLRSGPENARRIAHEAEGSPYLVEELIRFPEAGGGQEGLSRTDSTRPCTSGSPGFPRASPLAPHRCGRRWDGRGGHRHPGRRAPARQGAQGGEPASRRAPAPPPPRGDRARYVQRPGTRDRGRTPRS